MSLGGRRIVEWIQRLVTPSTRCSATRPGLPPDLSCSNAVWPRTRSIRGCAPVVCSSSDDPPTEGLAVFEAFGLPMPKTQRVVRRSGRFAARVDFEFDARPVVVEALGYAFHRSRQDLDRDTARAAEIQLTGRSVYQFTTDQIVHRSAWVAQVVADALGVRCLSKAEGEKRLEQRRVLGAAAA